METTLPTPTSICVAVRWAPKLYQCKVKKIITNEYNPSKINIQLIITKEAAQWLIDEKNKLEMLDTSSARVYEDNQTELTVYAAYWNQDEDPIEVNQLLPFKFCIRRNKVNDKDYLNLNAYKYPRKRSESIVIHEPQEQPTEDKNEEVNLDDLVNQISKEEFNLDELVKQDNEQVVTPLKIGRKPTPPEVIKRVRKNP